MSGMRDEINRMEGNAQKHFGESGNDEDDEEGEGESWEPDESNQQRAIYLPSANSGKLPSSSMIRACERIGSLSKHFGGRERDREKGYDSLTHISLAHQRLRLSLLKLTWLFKNQESLVISHFLFWFCSIYLAFCWKQALWTWKQFFFSFLWSCTSDFITLVKND